jgi:hypothetical protein
MWRLASSFVLKLFMFLYKQDICIQAWHPVLTILATRHLNDSLLQTSPSITFIFCFNTVISVYAHQVVCFLLRLVPLTPGYVPALLLLCLTRLQQFMNIFPLRHYTETLPSCIWYLELGFSHSALRSKAAWSMIHFGKEQTVTLLCFVVRLQYLLTIRNQKQDGRREKNSHWDLRNVNTYWC